MLQREECEALLVEQLEWAWRTMTRLCGRFRMANADTDDFVSWATLKLVENDYHVIRQFRFDSAPRTYLTVVLSTLHREFRARHWGRWRPSAAARRGGPLAIELERLTRRDRLSVHQAALTLHTRGQHGMTMRDLVRLGWSLQAKSGSAPVEFTPFTSEAVDERGADERIAAVESDTARAAIECALRRALDHLSSEDLEVIRLRYWLGLSIAEISRRLRIPQKPLYRRIVRSIAALRRHLEAEGVTRVDAMELLEEPAA